MKYLEAKRVVDTFEGGTPLRFVLAMSGASDALEIFMRASAAQQQRSAEVRTLPFNTLVQRLLTDPPENEVEVWLLFPWDFVPEIDWRSGMPSGPCDRAGIYSRIQQVVDRLALRRNARLAYVAAPHLPLFPDSRENSSLSVALMAQVSALGARILPAEFFALGTYLASGGPVASAALSQTADAIVSLATLSGGVSRKLLVTDFDNVLWNGVVADDGLQGIVCRPEGSGYKHFLYQTLLLTLKNEGVLLAGVSRNVEGDALAPLRNGMTLVGEQDFVSILASYHPKSVQLRSLSSRLNIGLDAVVFVDDNPIELAEVASGLPQVECVAFPVSDEELPDFFGRIRGLFARTVITAEDRERTELYRRRAEGLLPVSGEASDLKSFLEGLGMRLTVHDRTSQNRERALQLINKTNQFNINGRRVTEPELLEVLGSGGHLYTATLSDRTGTHGEILACLISKDRIVECFVLSCRVFQRHIEHAFVCWLARHQAPAAFRHTVTPANKPAQEFFEDSAFRADSLGLVEFDPKVFVNRHEEALALCGVTTA